jgi:hypothetical protein
MVAFNETVAPDYIGQKVIGLYMILKIKMTADDEKPNFEAFTLFF